MHAINILVTVPRLCQALYTHHMCAALCMLGKEMCVEQAFNCIASQETQELRQKAEQTAFDLAQEKNELTAEVNHCSSLQSRCLLILNTSERCMSIR